MKKARANIPTLDSTLGTCSGLRGGLLGTACPLYWPPTHENAALRAVSLKGSVPWPPKAQVPSPEFSKFPRPTMPSARLKHEARMKASHRHNGIRSVRCGMFGFFF